MTRVMGGFAVVIAAAALGFADGRPALSSASVGIEGRANANVSIDARRNLGALTWAATKGRATDVYAAISRDGGRTCATPARVNDVPGAASVGGEQPPRIAIVEHDGPSC